MEYVVCAFRSRSETLKFRDFLEKNGIKCELVNTPKEAGVGCGLSVKTYPSMIPVMKNALRISKVKSFAGFFLVKHVGGKRIVKSI